MKKLIKSLLMVLPMALVLASCTPSIKNNNLPNAAETPAEPGVNTSTCYLVLTRNGLYNGEKGQKVADKFLENTVVYEAEANSKLPGADVITSSIKDVVFSNWISYQHEGKPTIHTTMPKDGSILYAFFKTNNIHNGEQSEKDPNADPKPDVPTTEKLSIKSDKQTVEATYTGLANNVKGSSQYHAKVTFAVGEVWNIEYKNTEKVDKWETGSNNAFTKKQMEVSNKDALVNVAGTYDIYVKIYGNGWIDCWVSAIDVPSNPDGDNSSSEETNKSVTITVTNLKADDINKYDFGIWTWKDGPDGHWVKPTVNVRDKSLTFTLEKGETKFIVACFDKGAALDWSNSKGQTQDISIQSGVTTYDISKLWK